MGLVVAENITKVYSVVATKVSKDYQAGEIAIRALNEVSFEIEPASFVSFVGPSGSGKTTLLNFHIESFNVISGAQMDRNGFLIGLDY